MTDVLIYKLKELIKKNHTDIKYKEIIDELYDIIFESMDQYRKEINRMDELFHNSQRRETDQTYKNNDLKEKILNLESQISTLKKEKEPK